MSEPVGNSPRSLSDMPGNTHKEREARQEKEAKEAPEKAEKIIEGKVITRKPPWFKRIARSMIAEDAQSLGDLLIIDVIVPSIKNLVADIIGQGTTRILFGTARNRGRSIVGDRPGLRTRYDLVGGGGAPEPRRMLSRESRARHDFSDVVLDTRAEAIDVVEALIRRVDRYGSASVSDLYDLVGVTGSFQDQRWGWTDLRTADVRQVRGGFLLDLPLPDPLR
jgi:hypothetical protein